MAATRAFILVLAVSLASGLKFQNSTGGAAVEQTTVEFEVRTKPDAAPVVLRIQLRPDWAPLGVQRFQQLVSGGFFSDVGFFRVVPGFVVQFGLPARPAPAGWPAALRDEPVKASNARGTLVFAKSGPNSRTSQLFINLADNSNLDGMGFAPIGKVVEGMTIVDSINPQYGQRPNQAKIRAEGNVYLDREFPKLSKIVNASCK